MTTLLEEEIAPTEDMTPGEMDMSAYESLLADENLVEEPGLDPMDHAWNRTTADMAGLRESAGAVVGENYGTPMVSQAAERDLQNPHFYDGAMETDIGETYNDFTMFESIANNLREDPAFASVIQDLEGAMAELDTMGVARENRMQEMEETSPDVGGEESLDNREARDPERMKEIEEERAAAAKMFESAM